MEDADENTSKKWIGAQGNCNETEKTTVYILIFKSETDVPVSILYVLHGPSLKKRRVMLKKSNIEIYKHFSFFAVLSLQNRCESEVG